MCNGEVVAVMVRACMGLTVHSKQLRTYISHKKVNVLCPGACSYPYRSKPIPIFVVRLYP